MHPVITPACRVPHAMKSKVKTELDKLTEREFITLVEEPTNWLFQKRLDQALERLSGVIGVSDDIIVYGERGMNSTAFLNRCRVVGMKLNNEKAGLRKTEYPF